MRSGLLRDHVIQDGHAICAVHLPEGGIVVPILGVATRPVVVALVAVVYKACAVCLREGRGREVSRDARHLAVGRPTRIRRVERRLVGRRGQAELQGECRLGYARGRSSVWLARPLLLTKDGLGHRPPCRVRVVVHGLCGPFVPLWGGRRRHRWG